MRPSRPSPWRWLARLALGAVLLTWALSLVELEDLGGLLVRCRPLPLAEAFVLFLGAALASSLAWQVLLIPLGFRLHLGQAVRLSMIGFFLNNLIPSGLGGDVYRVFALSGFGVPRVQAAASVVVERWSAFLALLVATGLSYAAAFPLLRGAEAPDFLQSLWPPLAHLRLDWLMGLFLLALALAFAGSTCLALSAGRSGAPLLERFSLGVPTAGFLAVLQQYRRHPATFLAASAINLASPLLEGLAFSSIADALGLELSPLLFLAFTPIFRVLNHLPVSVNAVGTQELASIVFWNPLGATPDQAVAISLLIHALKISVSALGAPLYLVGNRYQVERFEVPGPGKKGCPAGGESFPSGHPCGGDRAEGGGTRLARTRSAQPEDPIEGMNRP